MNTSHVSLFELDPEARRREAERRGWAAREAPPIPTVEELDQLYGFDVYQDQDGGAYDGEVAVEELTPEVNAQDVVWRAGIDAKLDDVGHVRLDGSGVSHDTQRTAADAGDMLRDLGVATAGAESHLQEVSASTVIAAGLVGEGPDDNTGRLEYRQQQAAAHTVLATEFDSALQRGEYDPLQRLPLSAAQQVAAWLSEVRRQYGEAAAAPTEVLAPIGQYIAAAEAVAVQTDQDVITTTDSSGEVIVESADDVVLDILQGDAQARQRLGAVDLEQFDQTQQALLEAYQCIHVMELPAASQQQLVQQLLRALTTESTTDTWRQAA